jgi:hypothetical protein
LISVVSVVGRSSLFFIGADRADPMPGKNERQGRSANIFFFHEGSLRGRCFQVERRKREEGVIEATGRSHRDAGFPHTY